MLDNIGAVLRPTKQEQVSYIAFSAEINFETVASLLAVVHEQVRQGATAINLLLSTPGGQVAAGLAAYNQLKGIPIRLTTHNVGSVDSIGNVLFLAGQHRYACRSATFMFHGVAHGVNQPALDEKMLREMLGTIDSDQTRIAAVICDETRLPIDVVKQMFREARTTDAAFALDHGFIHEIRDVAIPVGAPFVQMAFQQR